MTIFTISCGHVGIYEELAVGIKNILSSPKDLTLDEINKVPYASMQVRLGRTPNVLVVLEEDRQGVLKWTTSNQIKIYTKNGKIVRLTGTENILERVDLDPKYPLLNKQILNEDLNVSLISFYSFKNPNLYDLPVRSEFKFIKNEKINILNQEVDTLLFEEISQKNDIYWSFKNYYWVDKKEKIVIKSIQNFTPKNPKLFFSITRKYKKPE
tara:strand:- start:536 stop:1168 length:633 start_codon:yes stop_codon:yes gene_type:complete